MFRRSLFNFLLLVALCCNRIVACGDTIPVVAQQTATRVVEVNWTPVDINVPSVLYRCYPGQSEAVQIALLFGNSYIDHHNRAVCDDTVRYTVVQNIGGQQHSGDAELNVIDMEPTAPAEWGVVTVEEESQKITLRWNPSIDTDIVGYMVLEGSPSMVIDTVFGRLNTSYVPIDYPIDDIFHFKLCAFDSCRQASALTDMCNNMVLILNADDCDRNITATWNSYQNMPNGLARYELWVSEDGGAFAEKLRVNDGEATAQVFTVSGQAQSIRAYVKAVGNGGNISLSNIVSVTFGTAQRPQYMYLRKVSTDDDGMVVTVVGQTDPSFSGTDYKVYRSVDGSQNTVVGHCSPLADGTLFWQDRLSQRLHGVYTYWFGVLDGCGRNDVFTQKGSVIIPTVEEQGDIVSICWNGFEGWTGATQYELLMSGIDDVWSQAASTTGTETNIETEKSGTLRFKVVAWEAANSSWQRDDSLQSFVVELRRRTEIWMPNAFTPQENSNRTFGPVFSNIIEDGYSFRVFDRHGTVVFSSVDPGETWDGTFHGKILPAGAYIYKVTYKQSDGTEQIKTGTVILLL